MNHQTPVTVAVIASLIGVAGSYALAQTRRPALSRWVMSVASTHGAMLEPEDGAGEMRPGSTGWADVNGIRLYHEIYGTGEPLVLLHGGLMTIPEMAPLTAALADERRVIAVELQGHGRTPDTDRPVRLETMGDDVAALIAFLGLEKADLVGYSLGGEVALRTAIQHPDRVRRMVLLSIPYARSGWHPEVLEAMAQVDSRMAGVLVNAPVGAAAREWPQPERFGQFLDKLGAMMAVDYDWSAEVRRLAMPVMLVYADHDAISVRHMAEFFALLGGGLKDAGWQNAQFTKARLAIVPGYSHYNLVTAPELGPCIEKFLAEPPAKPRGGEPAAASRSPQ